MSSQTFRTQNRLPYVPSYQLTQQFSALHIAPEIAPGEIKQCTADTETDKLHIIIIVLQDMTIQRWQKGFATIGFKQFGTWAYYCMLVQ
ncbi:MAG TPA: hypothetical protein DF610_15250 [Sphingobacterium sp.]|nr:hypothetical protein [Sphingobacterium sp.]